MRVVSLFPAATEIVATLGAGGNLAAISHECDFPLSVQHLPRVTTTPVNNSAPGGAIDVQVRALCAAGTPVIAVDAARLRSLMPIDLIITQGLCEVCAVADGEVHRLAELLQPAPTVLSLSAHDLNGIWEDIRRVGRAVDAADDAEELVLGLQWRLGRIPQQAHHRVSQAISIPRVICIEWLDPLFLAGHWVPDLVHAAGGEDVGAEPGKPSRQASWDEIERLRPNLVIVSLCGFDVERAGRELAQLESPQAARFLSSVPTWILDGNAYTSRPGPRVVDGAERLHAAMLGVAMPGLIRWRD